MFKFPAGLLDAEDDVPRDLRPQVLGTGAYRNIAMRIAPPVVSPEDLAAAYDLAARGGIVVQPMKRKRKPVKPIQPGDSPITW